MPANRKLQEFSSIDPRDLADIRALALLNPDKFIQTQFEVQDKDSGLLLPFRYNWKQRFVSGKLKELAKNRDPLRAFVLKSRQVGMTTWTSARMAMHAWASDRTRCAIIAHREDRAKEILEKCKFFLDRMDPDLKLDLDRDAKDQIRFADTKSSIMVVTAAQAQKLRGETARHAIFSEAALCRGFGDTIREIESVVPIRASDTSIIIETTGKNFNGECHHFYQDAENRRNRYIPIFVPWMDDPNDRYNFQNTREKDKLVLIAKEYSEDLVNKSTHFNWSANQLVWAYFQLRDQCHGDWERFCEDFPCSATEAWQSKAKTYFGQATLASFQPSEYPYQVRTFEGRNLHETFSDFSELNLASSVNPNDSRPYLKVWENANPSGQYIIGADVSGGEHDSTFSSAFVIDMLTREMMCEFHGRVRPDEFAYILASMGNIYANAIIAPEFNNHGYALIQELQKIYFNLYRWRVTDSFKLKMTNKVGWVTNSWSRPFMLDVFRRICQEVYRGTLDDPGIIKSPELLNEMYTFAETDMTGRPEAINGAWDDRVMSVAIAHVVASQETQGGQHDISKIIQSRQEAFREQAFLRTQDTDAYNRTMTPMEAITRMQDGIYNDRSINPRGWEITYE